MVRSDLQMGWSLSIPATPRMLSRDSPNVMVARVELSCRELENLALFLSKGDGSTTGTAIRAASVNTIV